MVGVMIENADIISKLIDISKSGTKIHYVAGNHDYVVRHLHVFPNKFNFTTSLGLNRDDVEYKFYHGWEFDKIQNHVYFDALCHTNTRQGKFINRTWELYLKYVNPVRYPLERLREWWAKRELETMLRPPEERGIKGTPKLSNCSVQVEGTVVISGHTHLPIAPYISPITGCWNVNSGSWAQGCSDIQNTYAFIEDDKLELRRFLK